MLRPDQQPVTSPKAALRGEPSYLWREGQERRLKMIVESAGGNIRGRILDNGCGMGLYAKKLMHHSQSVIGLEFDFERSYEAQKNVPMSGCAAGEYLPFASESFDLILSHEVLEHVQNDVQALNEMARVLKKNGSLVLFAPNRGYPFETHGIYWQGKYHFGNFPMVNYLPSIIRNKLAPHVRVYTTRDLYRLISGLHVHVVKKQIIFGAYDNIIARYPKLGKSIRGLLHLLEKTPLQVFGLSHFWVITKV